jgi:hypothetical protein
MTFRVTGDHVNPSQISVTANDTVDSAKFHIQQVTGLDPNTFLLYYQWRILHPEDKQLKDFDITDNGEFMIVLKNDNR